MMNGSAACAVSTRPRTSAYVQTRQLQTTLTADSSVASEGGTRALQADSVSPRMVATDRRGMASPG